MPPELEPAAPLPTASAGSRRRRRGGLRTLIACALAPLLSLSLPACSPWAMVERRVPTDTYSLSSDVAYGQHPRQRLDVYSPLVGTKPAPVFVFFYGGVWNSGTKDFYRFVGEAFAARGIVTVIPDYRLHPEVRFPDFIDDSARAVRWAIDNAAKFGGDPARVHVGGHSAGAYNAAMVALDPRYARAAGFDAARLAGFIGLAGPYDFLPLTGRTTRAVFGFPDTSPDTQPINFVSPGAPRTLLLYATSDNLVGRHNSENLAAKLREAGVSVRAVPYESLGHRTLVGSLARPLGWMSNAADEITAFIRDDSRTAAGAAVHGAR